MTGQEIKVSAQLKTQTQIEDATAIVHINDGIEKLVKKYPNAAKLSETTVEVTDTNEYYDIPEDILKIESVIDSYGCRLKSKFFVFEDDTIRIAFEGTFTIKYREYPAQITAIDDDLPIPRVFQSPLSYYVAHCETLKLYGASYPDTQSHLASFWAYEQESNTNYRKKKPRIIKSYWND